MFSDVFAADLSDITSFCLILDKLLKKVLLFIIRVVLSSTEETAQNFFGNVSESTESLATILRKELCAISARLKSYSDKKTETVHQQPPEISQEELEALNELKTYIKQLISTFNVYMKEYLNLLPLFSADRELRPISDAPASEKRHFSTDHNRKKMSKRKKETLEPVERPPTDQNFDLLAFTMEMGGKIQKVTSLPGMGGLPYVGKNSFMSPLLQSLWACDSLRNSLKNHSRSENSRLSSDLAEAFAIIGKSDKKFKFERYYSTELKFATKMALDSISSKMIKPKSKPTHWTIQEMTEALLLTIVEEYKWEDLSIKDLPFVMDRKQRKKCPNCQTIIYKNKEMCTMIQTRRFSPRDTSLADILSHPFHSLESIKNSPTEKCCDLFDPETDGIDSYPNCTKLKIISCTNPSGIRVDIPQELDLQGTKNMLKAFLVQSAQDILYSVVKYCDAWYIVKDYSIYKVLDFDFFLKRGEEVVLCFYELV